MNLRGWCFLFLRRFFDVAGRGPGGEFAGVVFIAIADDAIDINCHKNAAIAKPSELPLFRRPYVLLHTAPILSSACAPYGFVSSVTLALTC